MGRAIGYEPGWATGGDFWRCCEQFFAVTYIVLKPSGISGRFQDDSTRTHGWQISTSGDDVDSVGVNIEYGMNILREISSILCKYSEITGGAVCLPFWLREESNLPQLTLLYIGQLLLSYR